MALRLNVHSSLYLKIYSALIKQFTKQEWPAGKGRPGGKYGVWNKKDEKGIEVVKTKFSVSHRYFYERKGWAEDGDPISMDIDVLAKVLVYLDCSGDGIDSLMQNFYKLKQVPNDIIEAQSSQPQEKDAKKDSEKDANSYAISSTQQHISAENVTQNNINRYNINVHYGHPEPSNDVSALIYGFYQHIAAGSLAGYERGWKLFSDSFKNRIWIDQDTGTPYEQREKEGLEKFKAGYYFFRSLRETHVFNVKIEPTVANCMVYYEESLELPHIEELADISKTSIKNIRLLADKIEALSKIVDDHGGKGFQDKALIRLFYPTPTETIWFEHGVDHMRLKKSFPATTTSTISRLLKCRCVRENNQWYIDGLVPLHCREI